MQIDIPHDVEMSLAAQAQRCGTSPQALAVELLRQQVTTHEPTSDVNSENGAPEPQSLLEYLGDFVGCIDSSEVVPGGARMSDDPGDAFSEMMMEKRTQGKL